MKSCPNPILVASAPKTMKRNTYFAMAPMATP